MEPAYWKVKEVPFVPKLSLLMTEPVSNPTSPVSNPVSSLSGDSGIGGNIGSPGAVPSPISSFSPLDVLSSPQPLSPFVSRHLVASSGQGFLLGVSCVGEDGDSNMDCLSIPIPHELQEIVDSPISEDAIIRSVELMSSLTSSKILSMFLIGENQLLIGTDLGTLHSFEIVTNGNYRLQQHMCININEPILSITSRPLCHAPSPTSSISSTGSAPLSEILIGVPYGYVVILRGEVDQKGRLKDPLSKMSRRIVRLSNSPVDCIVNCIIHSTCSDKTETYWCSCGGNIIVLRSSDWQRLALIDTRIGQSFSESKIQEVIQLVNTDIGVWSTLSQSSTVVLWDKDSFIPKLQLTYCDHHRAPIVRSDVSVLHYTNPLLFIGTQRGDIIVFRIAEKRSTLPTSPPVMNHAPKLGYRFVTNSHIGPHPIVDIYTQSVGGEVRDLDDVIGREPSQVNILVVQGGKQRGQLHMFELSLTPPNSLRSSPTSSLASDSTVGSFRNTFSLTPRRLSVVSAVSDYTPLKN